MRTITILSKEECHLCDHAKEVVERLTEEFQLELEVVPMTTPEGQELAVRAGMLFPPAVLVDGQPYSYGRLSERHLRRELQRRRTPTRA